MASTGYGPRYRLYFDGDETKFDLWEVKFIAYLRLQKLYDTITASNDENIDEAKNADIYAELVQCLDDRSLSLIIRDAPNDGRRSMNILRNHYRPKGKPRVITLYTELTSLQKKENETITDYVLRAETTSASLRDAGENISDSLLVSMVLKGLPNSYRPFTTVITQKDEPLAFPEFKTALRNFEDTDKANSECSAATNAVMNLTDRQSKSIQHEM